MYLKRVQYESESASKSSSLTLQFMIRQNKIISSTNPWLWQKGTSVLAISSKRMCIWETKGNVIRRQKKLFAQYYNYTKSLHPKVPLDKQERHGQRTEGIWKDHRVVCKCRVGILLLCKWEKVTWVNIEISLRKSGETKCSMGVSVYKEWNSLAHLRVMRMEGKHVDGKEKRRAE